MNQQQFDYLSKKINAETSKRMSTVSKAHRIDVHWHNKLLNLIAKYRGMSIGPEADAILVELKDVLADGFFARTQFRKDCEEAITAYADEQKLLLISDYAQWIGSRESNRSINSRLWNSSHRKDSADAPDQE